MQQLEAGLASEWEEPYGFSFFRAAKDLNLASRISIWDLERVTSGRNPQPEVNWLKIESDNLVQAAFALKSYFA
jgi:hypothetical protein